MLIFSAEELTGIGAFANSFQSLTLSVSFEVYRSATDTKVGFADYIAACNLAETERPHIGQSTTGKPANAAGKKGTNYSQSLIGRLICMEPELVSISEGAVSVEQVKLSQAEIHQQLMGGVQEVEDENKLDELAR